MSLTVDRSPFDLELDKIRHALHDLSYGGKNMRARIHLVINLVDDFKEWGYKHLEMQNPDRQYLVWSEEHGAWWGPGRVGYTRYIKQAGRYSFKGAMEIEAEANKTLDIDKGQFHEVVIRDPFPL